MKAAFDEIMATAVKRQHEPQRVLADLLRAEISDKQARSIRYQLGIAKLPLAKDLDDFRFADTPINETLVRDLAGGGYAAGFPKLLRDISAREGVGLKPEYRSTSARVAATSQCFSPTSDQPPSVSSVSLRLLRIQVKIGVSRSV